MAWTTEDQGWLSLLREIGLGLGLHEPLRTKIIEEGYECLRGTLAAHDAEVARAAAEKAWNEDFASGKSRAMRHMSDEPSLSLDVPNPYRKEASDE